jgi:hypothetical protein
MIPVTRLEEWQHFCPVVEDHIEKYANAQYGDRGIEEIDKDANRRQTQDC